eukprot:10100257-Lingulodinium_polyedra.AAC.1
MPQSYVQLAQRLAHAERVFAAQKLQCPAHRPVTPVSATLVRLDARVGGRPSASLRGWLAAVVPVAGGHIAG